MGASKVTAGALNESRGLRAAATKCFHPSGSLIKNYDFIFD